jgi:hypothetical protein
MAGSLMFILHLALPSKAELATASHIWILTQLLIIDFHAGQ